MVAESPMIYPSEHPRSELCSVCQSILLRHNILMDFCRPCYVWMERPTYPPRDATPSVILIIVLTLVCARVLDYLYNARILDYSYNANRKKLFKALLLQTSLRKSPKNVHKIGEITFMVNSSKSETFHWPRYGLKLEIPSYSFINMISNDIRFIVQVFASGPFILPSTDVNPVSCFFWIKTMKKVNKPIKVYIEHCAAGDIRNLNFAIAHLDIKPPYTFELSNARQEFSVTNNFGAIYVNDFSIFSIIWKRLRGQVFRYVWMLYYRRIQVDIWEIDIIVTKDLGPFLQRIQSDYKNWNNYIKPARFEFDPEMKRITVQNVNQRVHNWKISAKYNPCHLNKRDVDDSRVDTALQCLQLQIEKDGSMFNQPPLEISFSGARDGIRTIMIPSYELNKDVQRRRVQCEEVLIDYPEICGQFRGARTKPELVDLLDLMVSKIPHKWDVMGVALGVPDEIMESTRRCTASLKGDDIEIFQHVLVEWVWSHPEPTWEIVFKALSSELVREVNLAEEIAAKLMRQEIDRQNHH